MSTGMMLQDTDYTKIEFKRDWNCSANTIDICGIDMGVFSDLYHNSTNSDKSKQISRIEYQQFCDEFVFEKLRGKSFGAAFCDRFGFYNNVLTQLSDKQAKFHIETLGYIK